MQTNELLNYLQTVLQLETGCRALRGMIAHNRNLADRLSQEPETVRPPARKASSGGRRAGIALLCLAAACFISVGCRLPYLVGGFDSVLLCQMVGFGILIFGVVFAIMAAVYLLAYWSEIRRLRRRQEEDEAAYQQELLDGDRRRMENRNSLVVVNHDYYTLMTRYQETAEILQQYYALDIIAPACRNLAAASMFVQYLQAGQCDSAAGCFARFEAERDGLVTELEEVRAEEVPETQSVLREALTWSEGQISRLCDQTSLAQQHLAVQAWNSRQASRNAWAQGDCARFRAKASR